MINQNGDRWTVYGRERIFIAGVESWNATQQAKADGTKVGSAGVGAPSLQTLVRNCLSSTTLDAAKFEKVGLPIEILALGLRFPWPGSTTASRARWGQ